MREIAVGPSALGPEAVALMAMHRRCPERSVLEVRAEALRVGSPLRAALLHVLHGCGTCGPAALVREGECCPRGRRLMAACRGWRARPA